MDKIMNEIETEMSKSFDYLCGYAKGKEEMRKEILKILFGIDTQVANIVTDILNENLNK